MSFLFCSTRVSDVPPLFDFRAWSIFGHSANYFSDVTRRDALWKRSVTNAVRAFHNRGSSKTSVKGRNYSLSWFPFSLFIYISLFVYWIIVQETNRWLTSRSYIRLFHCSFFFLEYNISFRIINSLINSRRNEGDKQRLLSEGVFALLFVSLASFFAA